MPHAPTTFELPIPCNTGLPAHPDFSHFPPFVRQRPAKNCRMLITHRAAHFMLCTCSPTSAKLPQPDNAAASIPAPIQHYQPADCACIVTRPSVLGCVSTQPCQVVAPTHCLPPPSHTSWPFCRRPFTDPIPIHSRQMPMMPVPLRPAVHPRPCLTTAHNVHPEQLHL